MLLVFIGALSTAVLAACVAFIINRWTGANARWLIPASAGAAMFGFTMWNDYTWFGRTAGALPETVVVTDSFTQPNPLQPWSLVVAPVNRFRAVDLGALAVHPERPGLRRAPVFLVTRYNPTLVSMQLFDCDGLRRADGAASGEDGLPPAAAWSSVAPDDPLLGTVCRAPTLG